MNSFNPLEAFDGHRPEIRTAEQRRSFNPEEVGDASFPENVELLKEFKYQEGRLLDDYFKTSRGINIFTRTLIPKEPKGGVFVCHSYASNLRHRHKKTMLMYALQGYVVTGAEYEGHGWSDGISALINSSVEMIDDVDEFLLLQQKAFPELPWLVHGESLGGMVALNLCLRSQERETPFEGAVLVAPMCMIAKERQPSWWAIGALKVVSMFVPSLSISPGKMKAEDSYRDPHARVELLRDPIHYLGRLRLATAREFHGATLRLEERLGELATPFFVLHGDKDTTVGIEGSQKLMQLTELLEEGKKQLHVVEDGLHGMLWAEEGKDKLWEHIVAWAQKLLD